MAAVYVSIGSNINKERNVPSAIRALYTRFGKLQVSPVYQTQAVGFTGDDFFNLVVGFITDSTPQQIAAELRNIEAKHDRVRGKEEFVARTLDLDQLLYDDLIIHADGVKVPHHDIVHYAFVLRPLADIAGHVMHPELGIPIKQLWANSAFQNQTLQRIHINFDVDD